MGRDEKKIDLPLDDIINSIAKHPAVKLIVETIRKKIVEGLDEAFSKGKKEEEKEE